VQLLNQAEEERQIAFANLLRAIRLFWWHAFCIQIDGNNKEALV